MEMITMEDYTSIHNLRSKGVSIRKISRLLKLSKNTVKKFLRSNEKPQYKIENNNDDKEECLINPTKSKWDLYKKEIIDMYYNKKLIGSRIFNDLRKSGANGSESGFYEYFRKIKGANTATYYVRIVVG